MKPEFVVRWATSTDGKWDIEAPKEGSPVRLNQRVMSFSIGKYVWVNVGEFPSIPDAVNAAEQLAKGRAA
jgi:hypothetical protein